jgi:ABC-2 type transport system permease protein
MMIKMLKKYWQIFWKFRKLRLMLLLEYRANFWFWTLVSTMWTIFNFFFFDLIVGARGTLGGWTRPEMYILLATFTMLDAFTWSFFLHNMTDYTESVFDGRLNLVLTRPIDPQYLLSIQSNSYSNVGRFLIGLSVLVVTLKTGGFPIHFWNVVGYILFLCISLVLIYCMWFMVATYSFWVDRLQNINELVPATRRVWQVPKEVFTGVVSTLFTVVLPLSLIATLPSEVLLGKAVWGWLVYMTVFTVVLFIATRIFFTISLRKYSGIAN